MLSTQLTYVKWLTVQQQLLDYGMIGIVAQKVYLLLFSNSNFTHILNIYIYDKVLKSYPYVLYKFLSRYKNISNLCNWIDPDKIQNDFKIDPLINISIDMKSFSSQMSTCYPFYPFVSLLVCVCVR